MARYDFRQGSFCVRTLTSLVTLFCCQLAVYGDETLQFPRGHREPLGNHRDPDGHIDIIENMISPQEFWDKYASQRRPALFKGAAKNFPAFNLWTDDYLMKNYGNMKVKLEGKVEKEEVPVGEKGLGQDTISSFLNTYIVKDSYVVSQLPDPMSHEVLVLPCVLCGTFKDRILEANFWLSSGGTKSLLHRDADNAFNCLLNGTKDWILIDPKHEDNIPIAIEAASAGGGFALLDPDSVNLLKYPKFIDVPWQYANITPGDCLFLPYGYWHRVLSYGSKNMAVSVLFSRLKTFEPYDCNQKLDYMPLRDVNMVWGYDGFGDQTMGNPDPYDAVEAFSNECTINKDFKQDAETVFRIIGEIQRPIDQDEETFDPEDLEQADLLHLIARNIVNILDRNNDGILVCSELVNRSLDVWKDVGDVMDADPANTEQLEYALYTPEDIRIVVQQAFDEQDKVLRFSDFTEVYTGKGGSTKIAEEAFAELDPGNNDFVTEEQLNQNLDRLLLLFTKPDKHDPSGAEFRDALLHDKTMDDIEELKKIQGSAASQPKHDEF
ncbi:uncharacterized protein LOC144451559 [Glandiceps talaboti]